MAENMMDKRYFAFLSINALRKNVDSAAGSVPERYIKEFHDALDTLEADGIDINIFRIPATEIKPKFYYTDYPRVEIKYTNEKYVPKELLLAKIDALITYLKIENSSVKLR